jgi:hypothetical protein
MPPISSAAIFTSDRGAHVVFVVKRPEANRWAELIGEEDKTRESNDVNPEARHAEQVGTI